MLGLSHSKVVDF